MTPAARVAAAIEVLDRIGSGTPAEKALTTWARGNRFAGSKDRAAIRDHVFDALRRRASLAMLGGGETGRALMIGALRSVRADPATVFTGEGYAPPPLSAEEALYQPPPAAEWPRAVRLDYPVWLDGELARSLGDDLEPVMERLRYRSSVFLRVNLIKAERETARAALLEDGVETIPHALSPTALLVTENARGVARSRAYREGLVELQDASSQAAVDLVGTAPTGQGRALDYCAGGGGKALALAALGWTVTAHDAEPNRMKDIPARTRRAGIEIAVAETAALTGSAPFDLVFVDAPCSGSGAWRRQPEARWTLTSQRLGDLMAIQDDVLRRGADLVAASGRLAYATCSLFACENRDRVERFLSERPDWSLSHVRQFSPLEGGDGFFIAILEKP